MVYIDERSHSQRRLMKISETHWKCWCRSCHGDSARAKKWAKSFESEADAMAWWREHKVSQRHTDLTAPAVLARHYAARKRSERLSEKMDEIFGPPANYVLRARELGHVIEWVANAPGDEGHRRPRAWACSCGASGQDRPGRLDHAAAVVG